MVEQDPTAMLPGPEGSAPEKSLEEPVEAPYSFWRWLGELIVLVAIAFAVAYLLKLFIVQPFYIPSGSMEPTLMPGDRILVNKFLYRFEDPRPQDVVVFEAPGDITKRDFIKRVVAVGGQTVELRGGEVHVDGKKLVEPYLSEVPDQSSFGPIEVPQGHVFVMGDNRTNSQDSRYFGSLPKSVLLGKAFVIYWPLTLRSGQKRTI